MSPVTRKPLPKKQPTRVGQPNKSPLPALEAKTLKGNASWEDDLLFDVHSYDDQSSEDQASYNQASYNQSSDNRASGERQLTDTPAGEASVASSSPNNRNSTGESGVGVDHSWRIAMDVVTRFRPVPGVVSNIIRAVYGRSETPATPDPFTFEPLRPLILRAAREETLQSHGAPMDQSLAEGVRVLGHDAAASISYVYCVCKRVRSKLPEVVTKPLTDDALLRAHIGYYLGKRAPVLGPGRGMLAGFSSRSGLGILLAAARTEQATAALGNLAAGADITEVCVDVFGCEATQVAAMSLIAGGYRKEIVFGLSEMGRSKTNITTTNTESNQWMSAFMIVDHLRSGKNDLIAEEWWRSLEIRSASLKAEIFQEVTKLKRRGHGWQWMIELALTTDAPEAAHAAQH